MALEHVVKGKTCSPPLPPSLYIHSNEQFQGQVHIIMGFQLILVQLRSSPSNNEKTLCLSFQNKTDESDVVICHSWLGGKKIMLALAAQSYAVVIMADT